MFKKKQQRPIADYRMTFDIVGISRPKPLTVLFPKNIAVISGDLVELRLVKITQKFK